MYFDDDGNLVAIRMNNWKFVFMEQRAEGTLRIWMEPFTVAPNAERRSTCAPTHSSGPT